MKNANKKYNYNKYTQKALNDNKNRRIIRSKSALSGVSFYPRLCVFRSNKNIYAQIIDDEKMKTLASSNGKLKESFEIGKKIAIDVIAKKVKKVIFDRRGYKYHGNVKKLAEGARKAGLKF